MRATSLRRNHSRRKRPREGRSAAGSSDGFSNGSAVLCPRPTETLLPMLLPMWCGGIGKVPRHSTLIAECRWSIICSMLLPGGFLAFCKSESVKKAAPKQWPKGSAGWKNRNRSHCSLVIAHLLFVIAWPPSDWIGPAEKAGSTITDVGNIRSSFSPLPFVKSSACILGEINESYAEVFHFSVVG